MRSDNARGSAGASSARGSSVLYLYHRVKGMEDSSARDSSMEDSSARDSSMGDSSALDSSTAGHSSVRGSSMRSGSVRGNSARGSSAGASSTGGSSVLNRVWETVVREPAQSEGQQCGTQQCAGIAVWEAAVRWTHLPLLRIHLPSCATLFISTHEALCRPRNWRRDGLSSSPSRLP